jgi:hypothetical protein
VRKYAPAREDGKKPYVATISEWGRQRTAIVWGKTASDAKYAAIGRMRYAYARVRRATPTDMDAGGAS